MARLTCIWYDYRTKTGVLIATAHLLELFVSARQLDSAWFTLAFSSLSECILEDAGAPGDLFTSGEVINYTRFALSGNIRTNKCQSGACSHGIRVECHKCYLAVKAASSKVDGRGKACSKRRWQIVQVREDAFIRMCASMIQPHRSGGRR